MLKVIVAAALIATPFLAQPAFAKGKAKADAPAAADHDGPVAYADLAAIDAKMNMPMKKHMHMKHHMAKKADDAAVAAPAAAAK